MQLCIIRHLRSPLHHWTKKVPTLTARFCIEVSSPCLIQWPEGEIPEVVTTFDSFHVVVKLVSAEHWRSKTHGDLNWTTGLSTLQIEISRNEPDSPPDVIVTPEGKRDLTLQGEYLRPKQGEYQAAAREIANRILRFFQYTLSTPSVKQIPKWDQALCAATWWDACGREVRGDVIFAVEPIPGRRGEMGVRKFTPAELPELQAFASKPIEPALTLTLLSDAQTAWFEGGLRRSVLELAICTEVMVKRRFFAGGSPAGAAFDHLEDKAKVSVRVLDLVDSVAEEAFGKSYKVEDPDNHKRIDHLFRCRNKIAHRGELSFRDDSGKAVAVDASLVETWWQAVSHLRTWLEALDDRP